MAKKNHLMTPEERAQHDFAGKLRRMTDKQLVEYVNARHSVLTPVPTSSRAGKRVHRPLCRLRQAHGSRYNRRYESRRPGSRY
jgi:hypothetical protein